MNVFSAKMTSLVLLKSHLYVFETTFLKYISFNPRPVHILQSVTWWSPGYGESIFKMYYSCINGAVKVRLLPTVIVRVAPPTTVGHLWAGKIQIGGKDVNIYCYILAGARKGIGIKENIIIDRGGRSVESDPPDVVIECVEKSLQLPPSPAQ